MLKENDVLKGKYKLLQKLGQGGMSEVWLAEDLELKKKWAVKGIDKTSAAYINALNRDGRLTEIEILNCLDSPFAPRIVDSFENDRVKCVIMDYIEGRTLSSMLEDGTIPKDPEIVISWIMDVCSLLSYLHRKNIVYRDMKPANIILTDDGTVKVVDYGIAKFAEPGNYEDESAVGTKGYAAPEQYRKISGPESDIYSVCITLYQLLSGTKKPGKLNTGGVMRNRYRLPEGLFAIIKKGCEKDPGKRFESAGSLRDALSEYEAYDERRIAVLRKKIRTARVLKNAAVIMFTLGLISFTVGVGQDSVRYQKLVNTNTSDREIRVSAYIEAAKLKPYSPTACEKLLDCYLEDGLSQEEIQSIGEIYENYEKCQWIKTKSCAKLSAEIALSLICSGEMSDGSSALLLQAYPYLLDCCSTGFADDLSKGLFAMARVETERSAISEADARELWNTISAMIAGLDHRIGRNVNEENLRVRSLTAVFLREHWEEFSAAGFSKAVSDFLLGGAV